MQPNQPCFQRQLVQARPMREAAVADELSSQHAPCLLPSGYCVGCVSDGLSRGKGLHCYAVVPSDGLPRCTADPPVAIAHLPLSIVTRSPWSSACEQAHTETEKANIQPAIGRRGNVHQKIGDGRTGRRKGCNGMLHGCTCHSPACPPEKKRHFSGSMSMSLVADMHGCTVATNPRLIFPSIDAPVIGYPTDLVVVDCEERTRDESKEGGAWIFSP